MSNTCRIGVGGPVGSGKTALIEAITPYFLKLGLQVLIITNDIVMPRIDMAIKDMSVKC